MEEADAAAAEKAAEHHLIHRGGEVLLSPGLLGQIADGAAAQGVVPDDGAGQGFQQAQQALEQGGFAAAVLAHDAEIVARPDLKAQPLPDSLPLIAQGHVPAVDPVFFVFRFAHERPSFRASTFRRMRLRYVSPASKSVRLTVWQDWKVSTLAPVVSAMASAIFRLLSSMV